MSKIHVLDESLANKIAAGEVIDRPVSVVKELVENAIDAGSTQVKVEVEDGGRRLIRVSDDGWGMDAEDAQLCFERHATSKISHTDDLFNIGTLGFRGEALSSIAAVSHVVLSTSQGGEGIEVEVEAGKILGTKAVGMSTGTTVEVNNLFFNTPARKKYLKGRSVELSHIIDLITRYGFSSSDVSFTLVSEGKTILSMPRTSQLLNSVVEVYGKELAKNLLPVEYKDGFVSVKGFIGKPYLTRQDRSHQTLFINGRYVKSDTVRNAVIEGYQGLLFHSRQPVFILHLVLDPRETDVNVHPSKQVIKVEKEEDLFKSVCEAVSSTLRAHNLTPEVGADSPSIRQPTLQYSKSTDSQQVLMEPDEEYQAETREAVGDEELTPGAEPQKKTFGIVHPLAQLNKLYILCESKDGLLIVDQHAAEERIFYEKILAQIAEKEVEQQALLEKMVLELTPSEAALVEELNSQLTEFGFDVERYGNQSVMVRQVPKLLSRITQEEMVDLLKELTSFSNAAKSLTKDKIATMACKKAIKGGDDLTMPQMRKLILELEQCEQPWACPHGRPTMLTITLGELEKKFLRTE